MADTRQVVCWALEQACQMRTGENWREPNQASQTLQELQSYAESLEKGKVVDGIWVWSNSLSNDYNENVIFIPSSGILANEIGMDYGGWENVTSTCRDCKANVFSSSTSGVAGCHGSIDVMNPFSEKLESLLWKTIHQYGLEQRLKECFLITKPLWFSFWIDTPLNQQQCEFLLELLPLCLPRLWGKDENDNEVEAIFDTDQFVFPDFNPSEYYGTEFKAFFRALKASINWNIPLHVSMASPGHTDFGYYTCFAHCPRCKAEADVERWTKKIESMNYQCKVCSYQYDPSITYKFEADKIEFDCYDLEEKLGENFDNYAIRYGEVNGVSKQQMIEALDNHRDGPTLRKVAEYRKRVNLLEEKYAPNILHNNWHNLPETLQLDLGGNIQLLLQLIKPGEFQMGNLKHEKEQPVHQVKFEKPFYFAVYPITQIQWKTLMGNNPSWCKLSRMSPVEQITWFDAQDFCFVLSEKVGRHMRLPTEAEWEYVCRAGTSTEYSFGENISLNFANYDNKIGKLEDYFHSDLKTRRNKPKPATTSVDKFEPNPWGIYDMHGNVYEWCQDSWHENYNGAPDDGSAWIDVNEPVEHVVRGGAANSSKETCRSSARKCLRANCGASKKNSTDENEVPSFMSFIFDSIEYYGVRVVCAATTNDV